MNKPLQIKRKVSSVFGFFSLSFLALCAVEVYERIHGELFALKQYWLYSSREFLP